jgi:outer membrane translocation and assembly module TamA
VSGRYSFSTTKTFDVTFDTETDEGEIGTIDRIFPQVRLSAFSAAISRDTRDDVVDPSRGWFLSGEGSVAARNLGGQVGFVKSYVQGLFFRRLPVTRRVVVAGRIAVGIADGFPRQVERTDADGNPIEGELVTIEDLPASERFFAGGDSTIRGFALDSVGTPRTITPTGFPRGGNAVLLLNGELRVPVWGDLGAAFFVDGGNVFERTTQLDLGELRGSVGFGVRYRSPIGPVRLDLGFKLDRRIVGNRLEPRRGIHFSIGHAF